MEKLEEPQEGSNMSREPTALPPADKGKATGRPPSRSVTTTQQTLQQLKTDIENTPGVVKTAADACKYLEQKQWSLPQQNITCSHLATVLLLLVTINQGSRKTTDKFSEHTANTIKAVAFLLKEAVVAQYIEQVLDQISQHANNIPTSLGTDTSMQVKESIDSLNATMQERVNSLQKVIEDIKSAPSATNLPFTNPEYSYRDALLNNHQPAHLPPSTIHEARPMNRLNIKACQVLIEIQSESEYPLKDINPTENNPTGMVKTAANNWLANRDRDDPSPLNTIICALTQYSNKELLMETNTPEAAAWIRQNASHIFQSLIGHPVKALGRLYPVIARFMPVLFQTNETGIRELESNANLPEKSIAQTIWIRNPDRRSNGQHHANLKILCTSPEAANSLILGSGQISHLGLQIRFHKDIKAPGTCNRCQEYGHTTSTCKAESSKCAKCGDPHFTSECHSQTTKCTPCGSNEHRTNDVKCPQRIAREDALLTKKPELLTPYYITAERWTWGLLTRTTTPNDGEEDTAHQHHRMHRGGTRQRNLLTNRGLAGTQRTLINSGFQRRPIQTGANGIPLRPKATSNNPPPSTVLTQVSPPTPRQTNTPVSESPSQSTTNLQ